MSGVVSENFFTFDEKLFAAEQQTQRIDCAMRKRDELSLIF
jgi:hypothetical protein